LQLLHVGGQKDDSVDDDVVGVGGDFRFNNGGQISSVNDKESGPNTLP
jgi:hypothetical protein